MHDIHHRLVVPTPTPSQTFASLADEVFLGASSQGVSACSVVFLDRDNAVVWRSPREEARPNRPLHAPPIPSGVTAAALQILEGPHEWIGTEIFLDVAPSDEGTVVRFTHRHWRDIDAMADNTTRWAHVLLGVKKWLERADPEDL